RVPGEPGKSHRRRGVAVGDTKRCGEAMSGIRHGVDNRHRWTGPQPYSAPDVATGEYHHRSSQPPRPRRPAVPATMPGRLGVSRAACPAWPGPTGHNHMRECPMRFDEYRAYDAVGLAELVAAGEVRPIELPELALARCAEVDPELDALTLLLEAPARKRAAGRLEGPFAGVPFLIKDLLQDYAGFPTSAGTGPLRGVPAAEHSIVVRRWLDAGLVIFGKTTTPEFGCKAVTVSRTFGITRNPWDLARTPGGSSGGSAAAVAAGVVPVAGANDGGGSIRIPAACTGLFGLKPGRGLVPNGPLAGDSILGAGVQGVVSRSVRDTAAMLDILSAPDPGAPYTVARPWQPYREAMAMPPGPLRIGFTDRSPLGTEVDEHAVAAVTRAARLLETLGHAVEPAEPAIDGQRLAQDFMTVWTAHLAASVAQTCARTGASPAAFDVDTQAMAAVGRALAAPELVAAGDRWNEYTRALADFHSRYDLLLSP